MRRLCRQLYYIAMLYVLKPRFWAVAIYLGFVITLSLNHVGTGNPMFLLCLSVVATNYFMENVAQQFVHYRSRLVPNFELPHVIFPAAVVLIASLLAAVLGGQAALNSIAIFAICTEFYLLLRLSYLFIGLFWLIVFLPLLLGYEIPELTLDLSPILSTLLIVLAIAGITLHCYQLAHLYEDDALYVQSAQTYCGVSSLTSNSKRNQQFPNGVVKDSWYKSSDRRLDREFKFHDNQLQAIAQLLQLSLGAKPSILKAVGGTIFPIVIAFLALLQAPTDSESDFPVFFWLIATVFAALMPGAQAGVELSQQRQFMSAELMWPLTREQLIDGLFKAATWNALVSWLVGNAGMVAALFLVPEIKVSAMLIITFSMLSASIAALMFGLALYDIKLASTIERVMWLSTTVIVCFGAMSLWWAQRSEIGDLPFWLAAGILGAVGIILKSNARQMWLNLELG